MTIVVLDNTRGNIPLRTAKSGSPTYTYTNDVALTTTTFWLQSFEDTDQIQTYLPFTQLRVINDDPSNVAYFCPNGNFERRREVKPNSSIIITDEKITRWKIFAKAGTIATSTVTVEAQTLPVTENEVLRAGVGNPLAKLKVLFGNVLGV